MQVWKALHAARCQCRTHKRRQKSPSGHHRTTLSGYIFATTARIDNRKKNLLSSNISSTSPYNMANFGLQAAEIRWRVWSTQANFNAFRVLFPLICKLRRDYFYPGLKIGLIMLIMTMTFSCSDSLTHSTGWRERRDRRSLCVKKVLDIAQGGL